MISEHSHMPGAIYALTGEDDHTSGQWQTFQHSYMPNDSTLLEATPYIRGDKVLELVEAATNLRACINETRGADATQAVRDVDAILAQLKEQDDE